MQPRMLVAFDTELRPMQVSVRVGQVSAIIFTFRCITDTCRGRMDLSPFRQNFEKNRNGQKYHHSLKEHPTFTKIAKFGCEML